MLPQITSSSVKVMRSHDYCHFEVVLSSTEATTPEQVDALRKEAARLADKAVEQYKVAKNNAESCQRDEWRLNELQQRAERCEKVPEGERTPEQKAVIKAFADRVHRRRQRYNYEDDWQEPDFDDTDELEF